MKLHHLAPLFALGWSLAHADNIPMPAIPAKVKQECAACHMVYPPALMGAPAWQRLMGGLDKHFGSDASLDAASLREINQWLSQHAGTYKRAESAPPEDRITRSAWFVRKHREVTPATWAKASVKSPANCMACHTRADEGRFGDRELRTPQ